MSRVPNGKNRRDSGLPHKGLNKMCPEDTYFYTFIRVVPVGCIATTRLTMTARLSRLVTGHPLFPVRNGRGSNSTLATGTRDLRLPRLETKWRWPRCVNLHLPDVEEDCLRLSARFSAFDPKTHALVHEKGKLSKSGSRFYLLGGLTLSWLTQKPHSCREVRADWFMSS
jgi:hypothetical protein